jgi:zinc transport system substrate-binding protein
MLFAAALAWAATPARAELKVVATIKPIHALVAGVMRDIAEPQLLVTGSASPHTFALTPSGARALHGADVFFRVSPGVEPFTVKILSALPASVRAVTLADAPGIEKLRVRQGDTFEDHEHGGADDAGHHETTSFDGHVWLDPENAKKIVAEIARVLAEASPADAPRLQANAARVSAEIDTLSAEIAGQLHPVRSRPYVVFHDAYQYFEHRYGLSPVGAITMGPEAQPGARRLTEIRRKIAGLDAVCVCAEPHYRRDIVAAVTEGGTTRTATLDPEGALLEPGPGAYAQLLRNLASSLRTCLAAN